MPRLGVRLGAGIPSHSLIYEISLNQMNGQCMSQSLRAVIVGGVAAGPKVASKIIRLRPDEALQRIIGSHPFPPSHG